MMGHLARHHWKFFFPQSTQIFKIIPFESSASAGWKGKERKINTRGRKGKNGILNGV
jgi:hypothetical protein